MLKYNFNRSIAYIVQRILNISDRFDFMSIKIVYKKSKFQFKHIRSSSDWPELVVVPPVQI